MEFAKPSIKTTLLFSYPDDASGMYYTSIRRFVMLTKNGKNPYRTLGRCAFATILCSLLFAASCGDDSSSSSGGESCTKNATKCGEGADANKLYTCTEDATFDKGVDCAANDSHKVCGGDTVKACVCDTQNNYVDINGTCEAKEQCDDEIHKYNPETNKCDCDPEKAVLVKDQCEKRQVCDADGQKYVEASNTCACDDEKYWTEGDDGCVCDEHRVNRGGVCKCDSDNNWHASSDGSCMSCDKIFFNDQCFEVQGTVTFGNYPQATETPEPIEWIVLAHQDNRLLLLSKYVIDVHEFDASHPSENDPDTYLYPTWAESDIRKWLNDVETGFMSDAFSSAEQAMIAEVTNKTSDYMNGESVVNAGGEDSNDKVFLLDISDVQNTDYFENSEALLAYGTAHIVGRACLPKPDNSGCTSKADKNQCTHLSCHAPWWLRSPKFLTTDAGYISYDFDSSSPNDIFDSESVDDINTGVRPALWVSLSSEF